MAIKVTYYLPFWNSRLNEKVDLGDKVKEIRDTTERLLLFFIFSTQ